jgi:choline dehydrogenase-like flavoprotein
MPVFIGSDVQADQELECDVCIVGSGAGGAHVAQRLASQNKRVIVLEDGGFHTSDKFDMTERTMVPRLYQEAGGRGTTDRSMQIVQGRAVGGSTVINWTTCFRTPKRVMEFWQEHHGVVGLSYEQLVPHWEQVEKRLNIVKMTLEQVNKNNLVTWNGAKKLGWHVDLLHRNVKHCGHTGYCGMGCPIDAKQSMLVTMLPEAVKAGADIYANAWVERVERDGRKCTKVVAKLRVPETDQLSGVTLTVKAKVVVLAGGGINTPALLLRSNVDANRRTGMRTFLHPAIGVLGVHEQRIDPFVGSPQYVHSDHLVDRGPDKIGMLIEGAHIFPMSLGSFFPSFGNEKQALMELMPNLSLTGVFLHDGFIVGEDNEGASVTLTPGGKPRVDYRWTSRLKEGFKTAVEAAMRIQLAGGARQVISAHPLYARSEAEVRSAVDQGAFGPNEVPVFSAHVMGGCAMGTNERMSVVDSRTLRHHGFDNLFVIDGSVFPTSLTVNPQLSIYGLASWASQFVLQAVA